MSKKRPLVKKAKSARPSAAKSKRKAPVRAPKKSAKKATSKIALSKGDSFSVYERTAHKALQSLLPYATRSKELRKKAGYPVMTDEPAFGLDVTFVTSPKMKSLNKKFRGKDEPTDVLSFPALEVFARQGHLGDLVICAPVLERQAKEIGHSPKQELQVLLVHGLLHLLGYDHEKSPRESKEMSKLEQKILGATGLIRRTVG